MSFCISYLKDDLFGSAKSRLELGTLVEEELTRVENHLVVGIKSSRSQARKAYW